LRRTTFHVSLGFLIPGVVALGSLLAVESLVMWRIAFGVGGVGGAVASARFALSKDAPAGPVPIGTWWAAGAVYLLFAVVAMSRPSVTFGDVALSPITQEGVLVTVQMLIGSFAAWRVFAMPALSPDPEQPS